RTEIQQRVDLQTRRRPLVLTGDAAAERVARPEQRRVDADLAADHLVDGDRLAERATQTQQHGGGDAGCGVGQTDTPDRLPLGRAESERAVGQLTRDPAEE